MKKLEMRDWIGVGYRAQVISCNLRAHRCGLKEKISVDEKEACVRKFAILGVLKRTQALTNMRPRWLSSLCFQSRCPLVTTKDGYMCGCVTRITSGALIYICEARS